MIRKQRHFCLQIVIGLMLISLVAFNPAETQTTAAADTGMKGQAEAKLSEMLGLPVTVKEYQLDYSTLRLKGVVIGDQSKTEKPFAQIHELSATLNFMSLLSGSLVLEDVAMASLAVRLPHELLTSMGKSRAPASGTVKFDPATFPIKKIRGNSIEVRFVGDRQKKTLVARLPIFEISKAEDQRSIAVQLSGALGTTAGSTGAGNAECSVRASVTIAGFSPFIGSATVDAGPSPVTEVLSLAELLMPGTIAGIDCRGGAAEAAFNYSKPGQKAAAVQARLVLRSVDLKTSNARQSVKGLQGELKLKGTVQNGVAEGTLEGVRLRGMVGAIGELGVDALRARFENLGTSAGVIQLEETTVAAFGTALRVSGAFKPSGSPQMRLLAKGSFDLTEAQKRLADSGDPVAKRLVMSGKTEIMADISGSMSAPEVRGGFQLVNGTIAVPDRKVRLENANIAVSVDQAGVTVKNCTAQIADGQLSLSGTVMNLKNPTMALSATLKRIDTGALLEILTAFAPSVPRDVKLTGIADLEASVKGTVQQPAVSGTLTLTNAGLDMPVMKRACTGVSGTLQFVQNGIQVRDFQGRWGTSDFRISGEVRDLATFNTDLQFVVKPLDVTDIAAFFLKGSGYKLTGAGEASGKMSGTPALLAVSGTTRIAAGELSLPLTTGNNNVYSVPFQNLESGFRYAAGKLAFSDAQAQVFGGRLKGNVLIDPRAKPIRFELQANGEALRVESFLAQNTSQKTAVAGPVNGTFAATGDTAGLTTWNGSGSLSLRNGTYKAPPVVTPILSALNLKQFESGDLSSGDGTFILQSGIMTTNDLTFVSTIGTAFYRGDVGLDTSLRGDLNLVFSQAAVNQSQTLKDLSLDGKSVSVPTKVRGTLLAPEFPGFSPGKLLELGLKRTGQKMLQEILTGKPKPAENTTASESRKVDPGQELLKELGGLFKKKKKKNPEPAPAPQPQAPAQPQPSVTAPATPTAPVATATPPAPAPAKKPQPIDKELKQLGKDLKKIFKF